VQSNGKGVETWCVGHYSIKILHKTYTHEVKITVNVWISIFVFVAGKLMALAYAEAATIAWWTSAMEGKTIKQLHHNWEAGRSIVAVAKRPSLFNWLCFGSVAFTAFAGLGTIFQKASSPKLWTDTTYDVPMSTKMAVEFPYGWSGIMSSANGDPGSIQISEELNTILREYNLFNDIQMQVDGCTNSSNVECIFDILGIGFEYDCTSGQMPFGVHKLVNISEALHTQFIDKLFEVNVTWGVNQSSPAWLEGNIDASWDSWRTNISVVFKDDPQCQDTFSRTRHCQLKPALVVYPVAVAQGVAQLRNPIGNASWSGTEKPDLQVDPVHSLLPYPAAVGSEIGSLGENSTIGGLAFIFKNLFSMRATYENDATAVYGYSSTGLLTTTYIDTMPSEALAQCNSTWIDPLQDIALQIREIMFRTSVHLALDNVQPAGVEMREDNPLPDAATYDSQHGIILYKNLSASSTELDLTHTIYRTDYTLLVIGLVLVVVAVASTIPLFWGYWSLGRQVSLSPWEFAKAFHAQSINPEQQHHVLNVGSNAEADDFVEMLGDVKVRYGEVGPQKLGLAPVDQVSHPVKGTKYL